eukprot:CAMPEP_0182924084 /NCGR_PEP_ID=MMETSP0105_2-20130417/5835_1 /TAXON_ID=81532 ORGANISM="Acanthoeca-like sp., Strain 10tr" /NCGR_SAMPLE_ID=MMETSP0105_2 /ASSEMBLY_ACC=CAM_ASM_000205 /LENGTH=156 /DNA_ID=CAMNT_0025061839 /DNA_START=140 /DNA_END=608 /DNA_ORIENTATION=-
MVGVMAVPACGVAVGPAGGKGSAQTPPPTPGQHRRGGVSIPNGGLETIHVTRVGGGNVGRASLKARRRGRLHPFEEPGDEAGGIDVLRRLTDCPRAPGAIARHVARQAFTSGWRVIPIPPERRDEAPLRKPKAVEGRILADGNVGTVARWWAHGPW